MSNKTGNLIPKSARKLYFDIGNSAIKICYREGGQWTDPIIFSNEDMHNVLEWLSELRHEFDFYVISSVVQRNTEILINGLGRGKNLLIRSEDIPGHHLDYQSVETLGIDRFLAGLGAWSQTKDASVVIDAGTACTADYMNGEGVFEGGVILPGISMMEKGIRENTPELPVVDRKLPEQWPGKSTIECLQWGLTGAFLDMIRSVLARYEQLGDFKLFLTGGDADFLDKILERDAVIDNRLVFKGMEYYVEEGFG